MLLPLLALIGPTTAAAGELHVTAPVTMVVHLDGMPQDFDTATSRVVARNLRGGSYQIEVRNAFDVLKAQLLVEVGDEELVTVAYQKKKLVETGRAAMPPGGTPPADPEAQLRAVAQEVEQAARQVEAAVEGVIDAARGPTSGGTTPSPPGDEVAAEPPPAPQEAPTP